MLDISFLPIIQQDFLKKLTSDNKNTIADEILITLINSVRKNYPERSAEILNGAHILMEDTKIYDILVCTSPSIFRTSSHYVGQKIEERSVNLHSMAEFLACKNKDGKA